MDLLQGENTQSIICVETTILSEDENSKDNEISTNCGDADLGSSQIKPVNEDSQEIQVIAEETPQEKHRKSNPLYDHDDNKPKFYNVKGNIVTPTLITKNLPDQFNSLPIYGYPNNNLELPTFYRNKLREFVGHDLNDEEFDNLSDYCSPHHLRTGDELQMSTNFPTSGYPSLNMLNEKKIIDDSSKTSDSAKLFIHKKLELRNENDTGGLYVKKLKYRGIRFLPFPTEDANSSDGAENKPQELHPGKDMMFRVRMYRSYHQANGRPQLKSVMRRSVFSCDAIVLGRQALSVLRDRFVCANDVGLRLDHSRDPDNLPQTNAKTLFPSGFLFINNVFYVDTRDGCSDHSSPIRSWATKRGLGHFPCRDMCDTLVQHVPLRLGHPEVYMHQGNCEHLFTFSEVRLLGPRDPLLLSHYPLHRSHSQHHTVYCTTCAEFCAKWIVSNCPRVPFDPAFFCDTCLKLYMYVDGKKVGDFKAYSFRGNELNTLKPQG
ncbi:hypothetical protein evm_013137 [Chilo suppressalis]|nr:hypothetical protein evm_013137 [Chilo suppressalis]